MKKAIASFITLIALVSQSFSTLPVVDYSHIAQDAVNEVVNFVKWTGTQVSALATQVNTLNTYTNSVTQLTRYGNPAYYTSQIPGISSVSQLANSGMTLWQNYERVKGMINPQQYSSTAYGVLSSFGQPSWTNMTSPMGIATTLNQGNLQFQTSQYAIVTQISTLINQIEQQKQVIQQQLYNDTQLMNSCTDSSGVQKYQAMITSLNASLAELNAREQTLHGQANLLMQQINAAQGITQQVNAARTSGWMQNNMESGFFPGGGQNATGTMLTHYAYQGDSSSDPQSAAGQGAFGFDSAPGSLVPMQSAALTPEAAQQYGLSPGQSFTVTSAGGQQLSLVYADVAPQTYNGKDLGSRIDIYDPQNSLGGGNSFGGNAVSVAAKSSIY